MYVKPYPRITRPFDSWELAFNDVPVLGTRFRLDAVMEFGRALEKLCNTPSQFDVLARPEPDNSHDELAIAVAGSWSTGWIFKKYYCVRLGYVPRKLAYRIAHETDSPIRLTFQSLHVPDVGDPVMLVDIYYARR